MSSETGRRRSAMSMTLGFCGACVALATGCSGTRPPQASIDTVTLGEVTDAAYVLQFDLELANPNDEPLDLYEIEYDLSVDGAPAYHGRRSAEAAVAGGLHKSLTIPAVVRFDHVAHDEVPRQIAYALRGRLWYLSQDTLAELFFDANLHRPSITFMTEGTLTFDSPPTVE